MVTIDYKFLVKDDIGRIWAKTLTGIKAARLVKELYQSKGLTCHVEAA